TPRGRRNLSPISPVAPKPIRTQLEVVEIANKLKRLTQIHKNPATAAVAANLPVALAPLVYNIQSGNNPRIIKITAPPMLNMSIETAKAQISKAIQGKAATRDTEVLGASNHDEWTNILGKGVKINRPRFGVVIYKVLTEEIKKKDFSSEDAARYAIQNGLVFGPNFVNRAEYYSLERKKCHRCQKLGHLA
ncbi:uncharacterized protein K452DRAFT_282585, partial [Aplosporella prunicola CBS 121167]